MRTFRAGAVSVIAQLTAVALVVGACSASSTPGTPTGTGGGSVGATASPTSPAPSGSQSPANVLISPQQLLTPADYVKAGIASGLVLNKQHKSTTAAADQRAAFGCWALTDVLRHVAGTTLRAKAVRAFSDRSKAHDVAQVVLDFASPAQAQRYGAQVSQRLATCAHPKLALAGVGPEFSSSSAEQLTTTCDRSGGFTAIATRELPHGSNSLVLAMLLVANGALFSLSLLLGPLSSNDPVERSKVADAVCARLSG